MRFEPTTFRLTYQRSTNWAIELKQQWALILNLWLSCGLRGCQLPQRSHLASELNSVTSLTHATMLLWPLNGSIIYMQTTHIRTYGQTSSIDLCGFATGRNWTWKQKDLISEDHISRNKWTVVVPHKPSLIYECIEVDKCFSGHAIIYGYHQRWSQILSLLEK